MSKEINPLSFCEAGVGRGWRTEIGLRDMCEVMLGTISRMIKDDIARLCTGVTAPAVGPFNVFSNAWDVSESQAMFVIATFEGRCDSSYFATFSNFQRKVRTSAKQLTFFETKKFYSLNLSCRVRVCKISGFIYSLNDVKL